MIQIPASFFDHTRVSREGAAGRAWAESLPALVAELCERWELRLDGAPMHGANGLAIPVRRGDDERVLKVAWPGPEFAQELLALRLLDGRSVVRLYESEADRGAALVERLDHERPLAYRPLSEVLAVAARLLRQGAIEVPPGTDLPSVAGMASELSETLAARASRLGDPLPSDLLERACRYATELASVDANLLVNWDLHAADILAADRQPWLAIDPRPAIGVPELGVAQLLWWQLDRMPDPAGPLRALDLVVREAELDPELARRWVYLRSVDYLLWGLANELTIDPVRCRRLIDVHDGRE